MQAKPRCGHRVAFAIKSKKAELTNSSRWPTGSNLPNYELYRRQRISFADSCILAYPILDETSRWSPALVTCGTIARIRAHPPVRV